MQTFESNMLYRTDWKFPVMIGHTDLIAVYRIGDRNCCMAYCWGTGGYTVFFSLQIALQRGFRLA
jgi:alpha-D-ribose 1-methylphosphonate 5-phosphate C-P lyase